MIGENIKCARKAKGLSQEELAVRLNVVRQTVSKWENNLSVPDADVLMRIAEVLEAPVERLLGTGAPCGDVQALTEQLARLNKKQPACCIPFPESGSGQCLQAPTGNRTMS